MNITATCTGCGLVASVTATLPLIGEGEDFGAQDSPEDWFLIFEGPDGIGHAYCPTCCCPDHARGLAAEVDQ